MTTNSQVRNAWELITRVAGITPDQWSYGSSYTTLYVHIHPDTLALLKVAGQQRQQQSSAAAAIMQPRQLLTKPTDVTSELNACDGSADTLDAVPSTGPRGVNHFDLSVRGMNNPDSSCESAVDLTSDAEDQTYFGPKLSSGLAGGLASPYDRADQQRIEQLSREVQTLKFQLADANARAATVEQIQALKTICLIRSRIHNLLPTPPQEAGPVDPAWVSVWFGTTLPALSVYGTGAEQRGPAAERIHQLEIELERSETISQATRRFNRGLGIKLNNLRTELRERIITHDELQGRFSAIRDRLDGVEAFNQAIIAPAGPLALSCRYTDDSEAIAAPRARALTESGLRSSTMSRAGTSSESGASQVVLMVPLPHWRPSGKRVGGGGGGAVSVSGAAQTGRPGIVGPRKMMKEKALASVPGPHRSKSDLPPRSESCDGCLLARQAHAWHDDSHWLHPQATRRSQ